MGGICRCHLHATGFKHRSLLMLLAGMARYEPHASELTHLQQRHSQSTHVLSLGQAEGVVLVKLRKLWWVLLTCVPQPLHGQSRAPTFVA